MDNSINFKGAIILRQPSRSIQSRILSKLGTNRLIFNNISPKGDVLYITSKDADKEVAEFLTRNKANFEFYTDLSTETGFKNKLFNEAKAIIAKSNSRILTTQEELIKFFKLKGYKSIFNPKKKDNSIENSLKALDLNNGKQTIIPRNGYSEVINADGELLARISGPGQDGISFAFVVQQDKKDAPLRYALKGNKKIFQYTSDFGRKQFLKHYNSAVKTNRTSTKSNTIHI